MRVKSLACVASVITLAFGALGQAQSLTDLARQEKERQARARAADGPAKVYTEGGASDSTASTEPSGTLTVMTATPTSRSTSAPKPGVAPAPAPSRSGEVTRSDRRSSRNVSVTLYVTSWCQYCRKALALVNSLPNLRVTIHDIERDKGRAAEMHAKTGGQGGIPVIDVEGTVIQGFSAGAITGAIDRARSR